MKATTTRTPKSRAKAAGAAMEAAIQGPDMREMIATAAYFRAEQRGFAGGTELDDWLAAEAEISRRLSLS